MTFKDSLAFLKSKDFTMVRYERKGYDAFLKEAKLKPNYPYILIAGSNGKGSTARYISSIYHEAKYNVGSFLSPWLHTPKEGILYKGKPIKEETFARIFEKYLPLFKKYNLSSFEITTAIMMEYFNEIHPDIAVIECGMGGEMDATNIHGSSPILSIITSVSLEHKAFLGNTTDKIAEAKAGIFRKNVPALIGSMDSKAYEVIKKRADDLLISLYNAPIPSDFLISGRTSSFLYKENERIELSSPAYSLALDAALAIKATRILSSQFPCSFKALKHGLKVPPLPARFEIQDHVIFDGAHNPEATKSLVKSLEYFLDNTKLVTLFASFKDKEYQQELALLKKISTAIYLTTFPHSRARMKDDYSFLDYPFIRDPFAAIEQLKKEYPEHYILVTGSLAFALYMAERGRKDVL